MPQCRVEHNVSRPARSRLKKPGIGFIDDHRTHIGSIGEVIKAGKFAESPVSRFLLKPGPQIHDPEARGGIGIPIVDVNPRPALRLQGS